MPYTHHFYSRHNVHCNREGGSMGSALGFSTTAVSTHSTSTVSGSVSRHSSSASAGAEEWQLAEILAEFSIRTSDIKVLGKLGEGNFGTVFRCVRIFSMNFLEVYF
jgi:hypothetical protein